jgi:molybdopterin converting factor small subunit
MRIAVKFQAQLKQAAGTACEQIDIEPPCSVRQLVLQLTERHGRGLQQFLLDPSGRVQATVLLFVGDEQVRSEDRVALQDGDVVTVLSPMAGG